MPRPKEGREEEGNARPPALTLSFHLSVSPRKRPLNVCHGGNTGRLAVGRPRTSRAEERRERM